MRLPLDIDTTTDGSNKANESSFLFTSFQEWKYVLLHVN